MPATNTRKRSKGQKKNNSGKRQRTDATVQDSDTTTESWLPETIIVQLEKVLRRKGNARDATAMKKYMRDQFEFFGVKSTPRREIIRQIMGGKKSGLSKTDIRKFAEVLWGKPQRELQHVAMEFLEKHRKTLCEEDSDFPENLEFFQMLITTKSWWDTVDMLAYKLVGYLVQTHPTMGKPAMHEWISSDNMWMRRTAILHQLGCKEDRDDEMLFQFCKARCHEEEFFIRKAIGWSLRDYAKTNPNKVKKFLLEHKDSLSKLSFNEAAKHLKMAKK